MATVRRRGSDAYSGFGVGMNPEPDLSVQRLRWRKRFLIPSWPWRGHHPDRWLRSYQAEYDRDGWMWCPRAYTKAGACRKARRWWTRGIDIERHERRYGSRPDLYALRASWNPESSAV